jgi:hypothetical protein
VSWPRVCRRGHVINGPADEHHGEHLQCRRCRLTSQERANAKYNASDNGTLVRWTYEASTRRYLMKAYARMDVTVSNLADLYAENDLEAPSWLAYERRELPSMDAVYRTRRTHQMIARAGGWDLYRIKISAGL